jgi:hypothetical protein
MVQANREENVPKPIQVDFVEKLTGEIQREIGAVVSQLRDQRWPIHRGDQQDQLFDLLCLKHIGDLVHYLPRPSDRLLG